MRDFGHVHEESVEISINGTFSLSQHDRLDCILQIVSNGAQLQACRVGLDSSQTGKPYWDLVVLVLPFDYKYKSIPSGPACETLSPLNISWLSIALHSTGSRISCSSRKSSIQAKSP